MGMDADVIGAGPYSDDIQHILDYPADYYHKTKPGTIILVTLFIAESTQESHELAEALGVDPWDFNTHRINPEKLDKGSLMEYACGAAGYGIEHVEAFFKLIEKGFSFFYRPNG